MRIAMAQISSGTDPARNLALMADVVASAAAEHASLVVFPEATMCRFGVRLTDVAEPLDGPWATEVSRLATSHDVTIVAGMFTPASDGRVYNTLLAAAPDGTRSGYDKIHLYDAFGFAESATVAGGSAPVTIDVGGHTVGLATCYDIRFPELFRNLADRGADLIVVPASWGAGPGKAHQWQVLATARALDCATYVAAVGQALPDDEAVRRAAAPTGIGFSMLTDPFGSVIATYGERVETATFDIDLSIVATARDTLGVLANRKLAR